MTNTIIINSKDFEITEGIRLYIVKKLNKSNTFLENEKIKVTLSNEAKGKKIQVVTKYLFEIIVVEDIDDDLYFAIDKVQDKLIKALRRRKDKVKNSKKKIANNYEKGIIDIEENIDENDAIKNKIVKYKKFNLKPMYVEEAILQMNLLKHNFFLFLNAETETMCVVYLRKDGNYGYIEGTV